MGVGVERRGLIILGCHYLGEPLFINTPLPDNTAGAGVFFFFFFFCGLQLRCFCRLRRRGV